MEVIGIDDAIVIGVITLFSSSLNIVANWDDIQQYTHILITTRFLKFHVIIILFSVNRHASKPQLPDHSPCFYFFTLPDLEEKRGYF